MPNTFAYAIMALWPVVIFMLMKKYGVGAGSLLALLTSYMFLPANLSIDLPVLPPLDKFSITTLTIIAIFVVKKIPLGINSLPKVYKWLLAVFFIAPFLTALSNSERYLHMPGLTLYDGLTSSIVSFLYFFPFLIGVKYFRELESHTKLFQYFAIAALVYAFFALYEIRMSPNLHSMLYGYFPHSWQQQYRDGGFRAVVFIGHGLLVAMFLALGVTFWATMKKAGLKVFRYSSLVAMGILVVTLIFMKTYSAIVYGAFAYCAINYLSKNQQISASLMIALLFITYPILTASGVFPHKELVSLASDFSVDRAGSLEYRFDNESVLLAHANEKPLLGWGGWGRNRVFDSATGQDVTVTDGYWIIVLGVSGWVGFLSKFLFLFLPIFFVFKSHRNMHYENESSKTLLAAHTLIISLIMIDQLPNSSLGSNSLYWLLAGSLLGRADELTKKQTFPGDKK